ncbi:MAG: MBL fold metallo-hydrolase, partial [Ruminococcus sp.]|nr:MBL fold metallo-hydrolase [Ruminococcus sp.]
NIYAGTAMGRRASYQYGTMLEASETGALAIGIGMGQSRGSTSYISPTLEITQTGEKHTIDGVEIEFQLTPGTEAPAEMNFWIGSKNALWMAENCTGALHNLYTLRGAQVRDGNAWAEYIMESLALYGDKADVVFQSHNWPHWGNDIIQEYMTNTAAVYKFINDQTLLYLNEGYTETEIANMIQLPEELEKVWYTRQYYGTVSHNSKAVYEKYMGWYDGNPVHLAELTPSDYAQKLVEYFGDTDARYLCADADVTWTTKRAGLLSIVQKNAENIAALIEQEGDETCLTRLMDAVTVTSEYKYFNIIEP